MSETTVFTGTDVREAAGQASQTLAVPLERLRLVLLTKEAGQVTIEAHPSDQEMNETYREEIATIRPLLEKLMDSLGIETELKFDVTPYKVDVELCEKSADVFREHQGERLNDLQFLVNRFLHARMPQSPLEVRLDANHFKQDREQELIDQALGLGNGLEKEGDSAMMDAMNSYERRIVHLALEKHKHLKTTSVGEGSLKRVKITCIQAKPVE